MNHQELQIPQTRCQFCLQVIEGQTFELELIEQTIKVCLKCNTKYTTSIDYFRLNTIKINELYKKKIELIMMSTKIYYKHKIQQCMICYGLCVCYKICKNEHYFCLSCQKILIQGQFHADSIKCPEENCDQEIDDYIRFCFVGEAQFQQWASQNYNYFCPNKSCKTILQIFPYLKVQTQIFQVDDNQSQCSSCGSQICAICWKEFKGTYIQHQNICSSDYYQTQILKKYMSKNGILQCPKCKFYSQQDCTIMKCNIQICQICGTKFCLFCKSADLELFYPAIPYHNYYHCLYNYFKSRKIQIITFWCLQLVYFLIIGIIAFLGYYSTRYIKKQVQQWNFRYKSCLLVMVFPLIIIFELIAGFCKFVLEHEYILLDITFKILGILDDMIFIQQFWVNDFE